MFKTILVATDGSNHAYKALLTAANLASKYDAKLIVLHVLMHGKVPEAFRHMAEFEHLVEPEKSQTMDLRNIPSNLAIMLSNVETGSDERRFYAIVGDNIIEDSKRKAKEGGAQHIVTKTAEGDAAEQIMRHANDEQVDLIVMGTRGLGEIKGLLVGSVTHKVMQLAECPCLTVK